MPTSFLIRAALAFLITAAFLLGAISAAHAQFKIVVAGDASSADFGVVRYNIDGSLDTSFDTDGKVTTDVSGGDQGKGIAIQTNGKIVVAGAAGMDFGVVRYNIDGSLDTTFGTGGKVITDIAGYQDVCNAVAIQSDGKIVVGGYTTISGTAFAVARYNTTDGSLDTDFDTDGKVTTDIGTSTDSGQAMAIQPDGRIVVAGYSPIGLNYEFAVVRYNTNGSLDTSFDTDGILTTDFAGSNDYGRAIAIQIDCESQDWWDFAYENRRQLTIDAAVSGYSMKLVLTGADATDIYGKCLASGNDFRVVWYNGCMWYDLDRELESFTSSNITVWFRIQEPSGWGGGASNYYLYYGNSSPAAVKANKSNIYDLWDDFTNWDNWTRFTEEGYSAPTAFIDGGSVNIGLTATTLAQLDTAFAAGNNFVIAVVQFDSTASAYVAAGDLILQRVGGSTLMSNFYDIYFTSAPFEGNGIP